LPLFSLRLALVFSHGLAAQRRFKADRWIRVYVFVLTHFLDANRPPLRLNMLEAGSRPAKDGRSWWGSTDRSSQGIAISASRRSAAMIGRRAPGRSQIDPWVDHFLLNIPREHVFRLLLSHFIWRAQIVAVPGTGRKPRGAPICLPPLNSLEYRMAPNAKSGRDGDRIKCRPAPFSRSPQ